MLKILCYLIIMVCCFQKLESLTLHRQDTLHTALENFCAAMPHMTKLDLSHAIRGDACRCGGVLRAIAANMHHLKSLNISGWMLDQPKAIEYLLPTEDNALGGCPELVDLNMEFVHNVDVELLKKIILALPKLRSLRHSKLVDALGDLKEEEMNEDTARCLNCLYARYIYSFCNYMLTHSISSFSRYAILVKSPALHRFKNTITTVVINVPVHGKRQKECALLADVLMLLPKLRNVTLCSIYESHKHMLPLLESIGGRLKYLDLECYTGDLSVQDIMRTCRNLAKLSLIYFECDPERSINDIDHDQVKEPNIQPVLNYLTEIDLSHLGEVVCSSETLITLLQSPNLRIVNLYRLKAMCDDVMFNALSSRGYTALSKITKFSVKECSLITAAPFVYWLSRDNCSLQHLCISICKKMNYETLKDAAEKYTKGLKIEFEEL